MQNAIIDACALLNLLRCQSAQYLLGNIKLSMTVQGLVEDEILDQSDDVDELVRCRLLTRYSGAKILARDVGEIAGKYRIGLGEAECIAIAVREKFGFVSDDRRARIVGSNILGRENVTGTIGILCRCIDSGFIDIEQASALLALAQQSGGYLPNFDFERRCISL